MAFPSNTGTTPNTLDEAWRLARDIAAQVKQTASDYKTNAAGGLSGRSVLGLSAFMADQFAAFGTLSAIPNIAAYAQTQVNNPSLDVAAAFNAMRTAISNVISWITTNFPKDVNGNLLYTQFTADGHITYTNFTSGQLAGLVTQLTALIATID